MPPETPSTSSPLRILVLSAFFAPQSTAAARRVYERARYWARWGHQITVITTLPSTPEDGVLPGYRIPWWQFWRWWRSETLDGMRVIRVRSFVARKNRAWQRLLEYLSFPLMALPVACLTRRPQVVLASTLPLFTGLVALPLRWFKRVPMVVEHADLWPDSILDTGMMKEGAWVRGVKRMEKMLHHRAAGVVVLSQRIGEAVLAKGANPQTLHVVPNGHDAEVLPPKTAPNQLAQQLGLTGKFVVGYMGNMGLAQGMQTVLEAARQCTDPDIAFLLVGGGAEQPALAKEAKGLPQVVMVERQPRERVGDYWALCQIALAPLRNRPVFATAIPSKMFEAWGMGVPLLLPVPEGDAKTLLEETSAGQWVPPEDPQALLQAILALKAAPEQRKAFAQAGQKAAQTYSRAAQAKATLKVLAQAATPSP